MVFNFTISKFNQYSTNISWFLGIIREFFWTFTGWHFMRMAQINSWNTGTPVTKAKKTMKSMPNKEFLNKLLIAMNLHQHVQGQAISSIYSRHVWFKNLVIWLAERILAHISRTRFFLTMGIVKGNIKQYTFIIEQIQQKSITKFFNKLKKKLISCPF